MANWLSRIFGRRNKTESFEQFRVRRWDAAETNRLNKAHWEKAGQLAFGTINADLYAQLPALRARCTHEAYNNPFVEGVIETHQTDIVGPDGPNMQIQSDSDDYNTAREQVWKEWFAAPDYNGVLTGVDCLRLWIRMLWTCGDYLVQLADKRRVAGPVRMRILNIHPTRLDTPLGMGYDPYLVMGVRRTLEGEPVGYYISEPTPIGTYAFSYDQYRELPPDDLIHQFKMFEPGQVRGFPWLSSALPAIADLRDYDLQVMDAARAAADKETLLFANHPDAPYFAANESTEVERRSITTIPPGWEPWQGQPSQPAAVYTDYRKERQREIGRPVNMPLMTVRLGSEDHNFSSARFDGKVYHRSLQVTQGWIARGCLNRLEDEVAREAELSGAIPPRPKRVTQDWGWTVPPFVDPQKEMEAYKIALEIGATDLGTVAVQTGTTLETLIARRKRVAELLHAAQLPPAPYWTPGGGAQPATKDDVRKAKQEQESSATAA